MTASGMITEELQERFITNAERAGATVEVISRDGVALAEALNRQCSAGTPMLLADPEWLDAELFQPFTANREVVTHPSDHQLATIQVGVTEAFAGVARTGSVCVLLNENLAGSVSLFTRKHVAVLETDRITYRPRDLFESPEYSQTGLNRDFVFITGPSATADMGPLVRGVHGPGELHIILMRSNV